MLNIIRAKGAGQELVMKEVNEERDRQKSNDEVMQGMQCASLGE